MRRVVGKCLLHHPTVAERFRVLQLLQLCVGGSVASPTVAHALQRAVAELPCNGDWAVLQVDVANAFKTVLRPAILQGASALTPAVVPWLQFCYSQTVPLYTGSTVIPSSVGTHQGCPLGHLGFALGVHNALQTPLRQSTVHWMSFYLDDGHLLGSVTDLAAGPSVLQTQLAAIGLNINLGK